MTLAYTFHLLYDCTQKVIAPWCNKIDGPLDFNSQPIKILEQYDGTIHFRDYQELKFVNLNKRAAEEYCKFHNGKLMDDDVSRIIEKTLN